MLRDPESLVAGVEETWESIDALCSSLSGDEWNKMTGCPGWSVKDNLSHIVGIEKELLGEPVPEHELPDLPHVKTDFARHIEVPIDVRRSRPPQEVFAEFREVTARRLDVLRGLDPAAFDDEVRGPLGANIPMRRLLSLRIFDCYAHEQDMRRAVGRRGHLDGTVGEHVRDLIALGLRRVDDPSRIEVTGQQETVLTTGEGTPVVTLSMPFETFVALGCGRADADMSTVRADGDEGAAARVTAAMAVTP